MSAMRTFLARLRGLFGGSRRDRELQIEIASHLAEAVEDNVREGMAPDEARRAALARFGGVTQTIEAHRERRRFTFFSTLAAGPSVRGADADPRARLRDSRHPDAGDRDSREHDDLQRRECPALHAAAGRAPGTDRADRDWQRRRCPRGYREAHATSCTRRCATTNTSFVALAAIRDVHGADQRQGARRTTTAKQTGVVRGEVVERELLRHARRSRGAGPGFHAG